MLDVPIDPDHALTFICNTKCFEVNPNIFEHDELLHSSPLDAKGPGRGATELY